VFVYDGWNLIKETVTGDTNGTYYVWGLDLSQSMQGAGGIGGLVCRVSGTAVHHYTYDANGNVGQLVDEDGAIVARYEYDPFGNEIRAEGDDAQNNPFRFSTKYLDAETGLYYYGFRYYSAEIGRWISRDPIGEDGGLNLMAFVQNNPANGVDSLGRFEIGKGRPLFYKTSDGRVVTSTPYDIYMSGYEGAVDKGQSIDPYQLSLDQQPFSMLGGRSMEMAFGHDIAAILCSVPTLFYITGAYIEFGFGGFLIFGPQGVITSVGGGLLMSDAVDKLQAINSGKTGFQSLLEMTYMSEEQIKTTMCIKEIGIFGIMVTGGFQGAYKPVGSNSGVKYALGEPVIPLNKTMDMALDPNLYARAVADKYGINLKGSGQNINLMFDVELGAGTGRLGRTLEAEGGLIIRFGPDSLIDEATLANTLAHELSHARDYLRGAGRLNPQLHKPHGTSISIGDGTPYGSGNALESYINGGR